MFISHNNAQLYTVEFGNGPRTLVAHGGWTGSWELWAEPFTQLSKTWRTVAYDHRGTGVTVAPTDSISIPTMVDDLFAVLDNLKIEKCVLGAESAGGMVALSAALQQPERFDGLVLVDVMYHHDTPSGETPFVTGLKNNFEKTIAAFVDSCVLESELNSAEIRAWGRKILQRATQASSIKLNECTYGIDLRPEISNIKIPTLVIHGDGDKLVPLEDSEWLTAHLPNSHLHIVNGAGHVPTITRPLEVAQIINQYFS
jgi:pimeloyl-ACP methyl ester carboxylesterase